MPAAASTQKSLAQLMQWDLFQNGKLQSSWTFLIPPESYEQSEPTRNNTVRTVSGGYSDLFGLDLPTFTLEGTTGYDVRRFSGGRTLDGYEHWLDFLQMFRSFANSPLLLPGSQYRLHFYNWTHRQYWSIMPTVCTWDMAVPENTVFYFQLEATGLEPLTQPNSTPPGPTYDTLVSSTTSAYASFSQTGAMHGAMASVLIGGQPSSYGQASLSGYDYSGILPASDLPSPQFYPGVAALLPSLTSFMGQAQPVLESAAQNSSFPDTNSYGQVLSLYSQGQSLLARVEALSPTPYLFAQEFGDMVDALGQLTLYPELMST